MARGAITTRTLTNGQKRYYAALWVALPGGGRKQVWKTFEKKRDAENYLDEKSKLVREGDYVEPAKISFGEFAKEWLDKYPKLAEKPMKPSTLNGYHSVVEAHLIPFFRDIQLRHIRTALIEKDFKSQLPAALSGKTVRNILMILRRMLESAVDWDYLPVNPFRGRKKVKLPKPPREQKGRALAPDEIRKLLDSCAADAYSIVATAVLSGMRRSEIFGLDWNCVNFKNNQIHVEQSLFWKVGKYWQESERGFVLVSPKSKASLRNIDMGPMLRKILLEHKLACGNPENGLVFRNSEGKPMDPDNFVKRRFLPAVKAAELGKLRFHDLRHTFGSLKIEQGENIKYVQIQMGHSDIKVTLDVYAHLLKDSNPEAAAKTDTTIFGSQFAAEA